MVRAVSGYDPERAERLAHWPLRELLLAYLELMRKQAREAHTVSLVLWAIQAPYMKDGARQRPPQRPAILREPDEQP